MTVTPATPIPSPSDSAALPEPHVHVPKGTLKERFFRAASWTLVAYIASQVLRLASNVILNHMLDLDAMGILTMAGVFIQGLQMFSDIGIGPSIIHSKRGADPEYLNTAWTIQIMRGFGLFLAGCLGAWPVSLYFHEPRLMILVPVCAFGCVIQGFNSTALVTLNRNLYMGKLTVREITGQVIQIIVTVSWAYFDPSVWALIAGNFAAVIFGTIVSYFMVPGHRNRPAYNREDARGMFHFGRWIFMSTALTFFAGQADKLLLGRKLGPDALALYGIAIQFALFAPQFIKKIGAAATFPVLSHIAREQPERFSHQLLRVRLLLVGGGVLVSLAFIFGGPTLVRILYPANRFDAGWMLQFLAAGAVGGVIISTYGNALLAHGKSGKIAFLLATHLVLLLAAALTGYHCGAEKGFVIGVSMVEWLNYPFVAFVMIRHRLWQPLIDLAAFLITGAGLAIALLWL